MVRLVTSREYYPLRSQVRLHLGANNLMGPAIPVVWEGLWASDHLLVFQCSMPGMASDIEPKISHWVLAGSKYAQKVRLPPLWASRSANEVHCSYRAWGIPRIKKKWYFCPPKIIYVSSFNLFFLVLPYLLTQKI
jgi:hypothetical protein